MNMKFGNILEQRFNNDLGEIKYGGLKYINGNSVEEFLINIDKYNRSLSNHGVVITIGGYSSISYSITISQILNDDRIYAFTYSFGTEFLSCLISYKNGKHFYRQLYGEN